MRVIITGISLWTSASYMVLNTVQGLTWLLPERFSDSEIGPEAGFVKLW